MRQLWSAPFGGKARIVRQLLPLLTPHTSYIEPFAGAGAVFWRKEPSPVEHLNDLDSEVIGMYAAVRDLSDDQITALSSLGWVANREFFVKMRDSTPRNNFEHARRFLYVHRHSFSGQGYVFADRSPFPASFWARLREGRSRLQDVTLTNNDALSILTPYAADASAFMYIDPPYPGEEQRFKTKFHYSFDQLAALATFLSTIRGHFLLSVGDNERTRIILDPHNFFRHSITTSRSVGNWRGGGIKVSTELLYSNYPLPGD
jgi:DNA adenine methylase